MAYADQRAPNFSNVLEAPPVTMESLLVHVKAHGLESKHQGYKDRELIYKTYAQARKDAVIHTARTYLTEPAYVDFLRTVGYPGWEAQAREDWRKLHGQE